MTVKATIKKAADNFESAMHNFGRSFIKMYQSPKCKGNGWEIRLENGDRVGWYLTKKQAQENAKRLELQIV